MESSKGQCIGQRNPVPFSAGTPAGKHMPSEKLETKAFKALGMADDPFPRQLFKEDETKEVNDR